MLAENTINQMEYNIDAIESLLSAHKDREAFHLLLQMKARSSGNVGQLRAIAAAMARAGEYGAALEIQDKLTVDNPGDVNILLEAVETRSALARTHASRSQTSKKLQELTSRSDLPPDAWIRISKCYGKISEHESMVVALCKGLTCPSTHLTAAHSLIHIYIRTGRKRKAAQLLRSILTDPSVLTAQLRLFGDLASKCGNSHLALAFAERLMGLLPNDIASIAFYYRCLSARGKQRRAINGLRPLIPQIISSGRPAVVLDAASVFSASEDFDAEARLLQSAAENMTHPNGLVELLQASLFSARHRPQSRLPVIRALWLRMSAFLRGNCHLGKETRR